MRADPAASAAVIASAREDCSEDADAGVAADASHVVVRLTRRRPINAIARRVVLAVNTAAR